VINVENKRESIVKKQTKGKQETGGNMNDMLFRTLLKRYEALIEDSLYKIQSLNENNLIIPEHVDITGEIDKLLAIIADSEDKLAAMRKYYGKKEADKTVL
jgi:DNA gyrase/topoisomerase IV subunit A